MYVCCLDTIWLAKRTDVWYVETGMRKPYDLININISIACRI